ncbi:MAG TPA: RidA family protein [Steroidobacteraceae bacterium]|nr:RidA family protein [Steroidobacteraceae bacterium]
MSLARFLEPEGWPRPAGYSNGVVAHGRQVFIAGQVGWNPRSGRFESASLVDQVAQALQNVLAVLAQANGRPEHIARMTWYLTSRAEYLAHLKEIGAAYRTVMGKHFPAMTAVEVAALVEGQAKVEIEATAVIP